MAQQTLLGGDGTTGETGATHNSKANSNFTELYTATSDAQADADSANSAISTHVSANPAHSAANISSASFGSIGATNVQAALEEIAAEAGAVTIPDASETVEGVAELATQAETNTGTDDLRIVTALKLRNRDAAATALSDGGTVDITTDKWTLATSASSRTFTISHTGQEQNGVITLSGTTITLTFPAATKCLTITGSTGSNVASITAAVSGDLILISTFKIGSVIIAIIRNLDR